MTPQATEPHDDAPTKDLKGIGGWLLLPLLHLIVNPILILWQTVQKFPSVLAQTPRHDPILAIVQIAFAPPWLVFIAFVTCLVRFLQRRQEVPLLMTILYGVSAAAGAVLWIALAGNNSFAQRVAATTMLPVNWFTLFLQIALALALIAYFQTSERVKNTFVTTAPRSIPAAQRSGIAGWLLMPLGILFLVFCAGVYGVLFSHLAAKTAYAIQHRHTGALLHNAITVLAVAFLAFCLVSILRKKHYARHLMIGAFVMLIASIASVDDWQKHATGKAIIIAILAAQIVYVFRSKRVKNTFVR